MTLGRFCIFLILLCLMEVSPGNCMEVTHEYKDIDILSPFVENHVETRRKNRLSHKFYELINPNHANSIDYNINSFRYNFPNKSVFGHRIHVNNPLKMISLLEPKHEGGCSKHQRATVLETSQQRKCLAAISVGFFNERTGQCYGNLISDGEEVNQFRGLKSANFGIRQDGSLVFGYLKETDVSDMRKPLYQLVSGVGWVLRNGDSYLKESLQHEQCNLENLEHFFGVESARTFIGHDADGIVQIIQVEGKTGHYGISLYESVKLLQSFGLVNAINLNGGGTASLIVNNTQVNYPSNVCSGEGEEKLCNLEVSSVLCVHMPDECIPGKSCSGNGHCKKGKCQCNAGWNGRECELNGLMLESCCWRNYNLVIVLSVIIASSILANVYLCDLIMLYRFRSKVLSQPTRRRKDRLRTYLRENSVISSNDESTDILTSVENLNT